MAIITGGGGSGLSEVPLGGTNYLVPADENTGIAVKSSGGGYIKLNPDGTVELIENVTIASEKTIDGVDISEEPLIPKYFVDILGSNISTNGTTEVDLVWDGTTADFQDGFGQTSGFGYNVIQCETDGLYSITCSVNSDYNTNNELMRLYMYYSDDGTESSFTKITLANRVQHTSSALGTQVSLVNFPKRLYADDLIKFTCNFTAADAGSYFLQSGTNVSIVRLHK